MTAWQVEPLGLWDRPITEPRQSSGRFRSTWDQTLTLLIHEIEHLEPTGAVAVRLDCDPTDVRRDGMLRARARVDFPGVIVSFTSASRGPLTFATDAYEQRWSGDLLGWQANVRAIALSLEALRAVDRYGVTKSGEQYVGWRAIEARPTGSFASPEAALRWMQDYAGMPEELGRAVYRAMARHVHPDAGGDPADWARLDEAKRLLEGTDLW